MNANGHRSEGQAGPPQAICVYLRSSAVKRQPSLTRYVTAATRGQASSRSSVRYGDVVFAHQLPESAPVFLCRLGGVSDVAFIHPEQLLDVILLEFRHDPGLGHLKRLRFLGAWGTWQVNVLALNGGQLRQSHGP